MRTLSLLALTLFLGCGPQASPEFVSRCGAEFMGTWPYGLKADRWGEANFQRLEDLTVSVFAADVADSRFTQHGICKALNGVKVWVHPQTHFTLKEVGYLQKFGPDGKTPLKVAGITGCVEQEIILADRPLSGTALPHEIGHIVQWCTPAPPGDPEDPEHANWDRDGIFAAIEKVLGMIP